MVRYLRNLLVKVVEHSAEVDGVGSNNQTSSHASEQIRLEVGLLRRAVVRIQQTRVRTPTLLCLVPLLTRHFRHAVRVHQSVVRRALGILKTPFKNKIEE